MNIPKRRLIFLICALVVGSFTGLSQDFKFGKVSKAELLEDSHPTHTEAEAAMLYREINTSINYNKEKGFFLVTEVFERVKIYSQNGFDWGTVEVALYTSTGGNKETLSGLKAYTYYILSDKIEKVKLSNSDVFDEKTSNHWNTKKFTMPSLKKGCIVEYKYKVKSPFIGKIDEFRFQEVIPLNKLKVRFEAPEYYNYRSHRRGWLPFNIETERKEITITNLSADRNSLGGGRAISSAGGKSQLKYMQNISEVEMDKVPPLPIEAYAGNIRNYATSLNYELEFVKFPNSIVETYSTDWESVSNTIYQAGSFGDQLDKSGYFEKELDQALNGASEPDERMLRIFEFVKQKMNWNGYVGIYTDEDVKKAFSLGTGNTADINLMLTAMFRYAGFNANPVLLSTKSNGIPIFPTVNGFNYVISAVETDGGTLLFDATNKYSEPNILDKNLLNWQGRIVRKNKSSNWVSLNPSKLAVEAFMVNATVGADGTVSGSIKNQFTGNIALENRRDFSGLSESDTGEELKGRYKQLSISEVAFENLENPYQPLKLNFNFSSQNFVEEINGNLYVSPLLFLCMEENPFNQEDRKFPVVYGYPSKKRYIVSINIPEGYKVESLPLGTKASMGDSVVAFKYLLSENSNKIQLSAEFSINRYFVSPEEYSDLKKFYQYMIDKEDEKIVLSKI